MNIKRQRLIFAAFTLLMLVSLIVAGVTVLTPKAHNANAASAFPAHYFAPYAEVGEGDSLTKAEQTTGQKYFTLAFAISEGSSCKASYPKPTSDIAYIRSQDGDVIQSFGGAAGQELAQTCTSASSLQAQYQSVVSTLDLTHLDFDIEGGQEGDASTYQRRNTALAALQEANPNLTISFTLPAATTGLESGSMSLLKDAVAKGVNFNMVNLMTMDYGNTSADEGDETLSSANGFHSQLKQIFPSKTSSQLWGMIGLTDLIGQNDDNEIFTASDGAKVLSFAKQNQIGELSFWALSRDNGSCPGSKTDSDTCDGLSQSSYAFTNSWKSFTNGSSTSSTSTSNSSTPTSTPSSSTPTSTSSSGIRISTPNSSTPTSTPNSSTPTSTPNNSTPTPTPTSTPNSTGSQLFAINQVYNIVNKNSGKVLNVQNQSLASGARIQQWTLTKGQEDQQWTLVSADSGYYYIVNKHSGKVLDDTDWSGANGAAIQQWTKKAQTNQEWSLVSAGDGYYYIQNRHSGKVLDVTDLSTSDGTMIQQWSKTDDHSNQEWKLQIA